MVTTTDHKTVLPQDDGPTVSGINSFYWNRRRSFLAKATSCIQADKAFIASLPLEERDRLEGLYLEITYQRRGYGRGGFYCWAHHPAFNVKGHGIDPWPASRYPKAVLMADLAERTPMPLHIYQTLSTQED